MNEIYKEVYFDRYCKACKYELHKEADYPCSQCLEEPVNLESHKPVLFEERLKWVEK